MTKILIVNNDIDTMTLLQAWLQRKNYIVEYTGDGEEVPQIAREFKPDVAIIDALQSESARRLKENEETRMIPVLLMTGYTLPKKTIHIDKADDVIEKPFDLSLLEQKIENLLRA